MDTPLVKLDGIQAFALLGGTGVLGQGGQTMDARVDWHRRARHRRSALPNSRVRRKAGSESRASREESPTASSARPAPPGKSGVFGFNSLEGGVGYGLFGRCDADEGAGAGAESSLGNGVRGHSRYNDAVVGLSDARSKSGVYGFNSNASGVAFGVYGRSNSPGGSASADQATMAMAPASVAVWRRCGSSRRTALELPLDGSHQTGELFVDIAGDLYFCKTGGAGPAAKWIKIA